MKVKQLLKQLFKADPEAEILVDMDGVWKPLGKVEEGYLMDNKTKLHDLVVRLQAKRTR